MTATDDIVLAVAGAIAAVEGVEPHELDYSLHEYVSTDAVRSLAAMDREGWALTFEVPGHTVTVRGTGAIAVDGETLRESDAVSTDEPR